MRCNIKPTKKQLDDQLKQGKTLKEIAEYFGKKSASSVKNWLLDYNLITNKVCATWTEEEDKFLAKNYPVYGYEYCGKKLKRSKDSIYQRCKKIGVSKNSKWQSLDKNWLIKCYQEENLTIKNIADLVDGIEFWDVYSALIHYDIKIDKTGKYYGKDHHNWSGYQEISHTHWVSIKRAAKRRSKEIDFNITIEEAWDLFIEQNRKCALSGVEIKFSPTGANRYEKTTASLDRIDSSKGYCLNNCQWVHKNINVMKMSLSDKEFIDWCSKVYNFNKDKN